MASKPCFDSSRYSLTLYGAVVLQYAKPAQSQMMILNAFELAGWPSRINISQLGTDSRSRWISSTQLRNAVGDLNRRQDQKIRIRFLIEQGGTYISWRIDVC